jgi:hypothetical protein
MMHVLRLKNKGYDRAIEAVDAPDCSLLEATLRSGALSRYEHA